MKVVEDYSVRHLDIIVDKDEQRKYHEVVADFIKRGAIVRMLRSGPQIDQETLNTVPNAYEMIVDVEESFADEFLKMLVE